jgi:hypothetical protein
MMRVIECNVCGETLSAADDDELLGAMRRHYESAHPSVEFDEAQERETVANEAYTASDS